MNDALSKIIMTTNETFAEMGIIVGAPPRHPDWHRVRKAWLKLQPVCQACGGTDKLEVHHIVPYWKEPRLELIVTNLITLCDAPYRHCHFIVGHLMHWASWNPDVREDAQRLLDKIRSRPR
jgi:hypothetical protein